MENLLEKIVSLSKRRGFIFPGSEIYGGLANSWDYGPLGIELKNNIKQLWWKKFVQSRDDMVGIDTALIMNPKVWEASGHLKEFSDLLVECKKCNCRFRDDEIKQTYLKDEKSLERMKKKIKSGFESNDVDVIDEAQKEIYWICPNCGEKNFGNHPKQFNLLFQTHIGPVNPIESMLKMFNLIRDEQGASVTKQYEKLDEVRKIFKNSIKEYSESIAYFRPETAQGMFVDFKNVLDTARKQIPFGIAQIGKAFRNEITPGNFIFRTREFEQMEIEYFIKETDWKKYFEYWRKQMIEWIKELGADIKKIHEVEIPEGERAHYSKRTIDFDYEFPFGKEELYGLAYRTDFDLKNHEKFSGKNLKYKDPETGEEFWPHVIEPTWGVDRSVLVVLLEAYSEEKDRVVLKLPFKLAPYKAAVFPLLANKPELVKLARKVYDDLRKDFSACGGSASGGMVAFDDRGNIGKRYYSQDEIGTPFCLTIDFDSLEKGDVTIRNRDTTKQERIKIENLKEILERRLAS